MLKIGYLAEKVRLTWEDAFRPIELFCCFPGNKISANKFEYQSMSSSLVLKIAPNGSSGSRFLAFSICLVADFTRCYRHEFLIFICKYQLTTASVGVNEKFTSQWSSFKEDETERKCTGDHVLILFKEDMVIKDEDYEEASFEFNIQNFIYNEKEKIEDEYIKVEKCGVHATESVGSVGEVTFVSSLPDSTSTGRIDNFDYVKRALSFRVVGDEHRLRNY
ncbi:hypothetical protein Gohar_025644, partial [Gossypium harknessii]|nr:hypothetical protein [Gossypium harknessii]